MLQADLVSSGCAFIFACFFCGEGVMLFYSHTHGRGALVPW